MVAFDGNAVGGDGGVGDGRVAGIVRVRIELIPVLVEQTPAYAGCR